ncbi:hypothetical protein C8T65DRAFT_681309 [Cerioporus squamosus]|nr:hypothetical protein C8T65DRAFT_681309 [Cerioporus squamosus]
MGKRSRAQTAACARTVEAGGGLRVREEAKARTCGCGGEVSQGEAGCACSRPREEDEQTSHAPRSGGSHPTLYVHSNSAAGSYRGVVQGEAGGRGCAACAEHGRYGGQ